ncbi:MAG: carbohydrate kinase family protein [Acidimicrobiia bacterium]|nr:carbohydrate kinase family protein [Acidimicrobiia bacterium]
MHEVYAYGVITPSTLIELGDSFPSPGGYAEVARVHPSVGGEAAGGAYVLARLGVATKVDGSHLGTDEASRRVVDTLTTAGVDCSALTLEDGPGPIAELIFAHADMRTVLGNYASFLSARAWNQPSREDIEASRYVCLDPFFGEASKQVAQWCLESGTPYVTIDTPPDSAIARNAEVLIVSEDYAVDQLGMPGADQDLLVTYSEHCQGLVILTRGGGTVICGRAGEAPREYAPFDIDARDTTGAGDSFRGGIIYGLLQGNDEAEMIRTASAIAAIVCTKPPSFLNSPNPNELAEFLEHQH